jgi:hypothetical protein
MNLVLYHALYYVSNHPLNLELSRVQKKELLLFIKSTSDKEEYRRAYTIKQKMEGIPYRAIAKDMGANYCYETEKNLLCSVL